MARLLLRLFSVLFAVSAASAASYAARCQDGGSPKPSTDSILPPDSPAIALQEEFAQTTHLVMLWDVIIAMAQSYLRLARPASEGPSPSPEYYNVDPANITADDYIVELIKTMWEYIRLISSLQQGGVHNLTFPSVPPSLTSPTPSPDAHDAAAVDMTGEEYFAEMVKLVVEIMASPNNTKPFKSRLPLPSPAPMTSITEELTNSSYAPGNQVYRLVPLSQVIDSPKIPFPPHMFYALWQALWSYIQIQTIERYPRIPGVHPTGDEELRQVLQQLRELPNRELLTKVVREVRGKANIAAVDEMVKVIEKVLEDVRHRLRNLDEHPQEDARVKRSSDHQESNQGQQEEPSVSRAKRNFTNSRYVDMSLVAGVLVMSFVVVVIGNLDPVTQTF